MPKITIRENDYTIPGLEGETNFSVVVPGFRRFKYIEDLKQSELPTDDLINSPFDCNGIYEVKNPNDFLSKVGPVPVTDVAITVTEAGETSTYIFNSYGNQIAYELLNLGYTVLYIDLGILDPEGTEFDSSKFVKLIKEDSPILEPLKDKVSYDFRFIISGLKVGTAGTPAVLDGTRKIYNRVSQEITKLASFKEADLNTVIATTDGAYSLGKSIRGDCTALVDIDDSVYSDGSLSSFDIIKQIQLNANTLCKGLNEGHSKTTVDHGKYLGLFAPSIIFDSLASSTASITKKVGSQDVTYDYRYSANPDLVAKSVNMKLPAYFYYLVCFSHSIRDLDYAEWYAAAGLTRGKGVLKPVASTINLGEIAINLLEPRYKLEIAGEGSGDEHVYFKNAVNVITKVRSSYVLWGNRTAYELGTKDEDDGDLVASHFMNIRQLCTTLKKEIYQACKKFTFDPNSDVLWVNFCNTIRPTLESMKANQGIENYAIEKIPVEQKATLKARVRIVPIEAVEDFDIEVALEDSITGETTATVLE